MFKRRSKLPEPVLEKNAGLSVKQADLGTTANGDSPPPSYSASAAQEPPPDISTAFANLNLHEPSAVAQTPTPDELLWLMAHVSSLYFQQQKFTLTNISLHLPPNWDVMPDHWRVDNGYGE